MCNKWNQFNSTMFCSSSLQTLNYLATLLFFFIPPNFMYGCIGIKKNNSVASSKIWMNVCLQWWWAEHGGIKLVPFVIHNLWVDPAAASCLSRWYSKLIMVHEKRWIELKKIILAMLFGINALDTKNLWIQTRQQPSSMASA